MPTVQDVLLTKGNKVVSVSPAATVLQATEKMNQHKIGALVVMDEGRIVGIFTERDILRRVVGEERRPSEILVAEVMTADVVCCDPDAEIDEVGALMKERRIRHVPVCDGESQLLGLISMGDINAHHAAAQQAQIHFLNEYIYGRV
jgi:CBS domain-containing protein